jgi:hypothetical protein
MLSIYSACYNVIENSFDYSFFIRNWYRFLNGEGEIVLAVNGSRDDTLKTLYDFVGLLKYTEPSNTSIRIIETDYSYDSPFFDGQIKNTALQACANEYAILLDLDEAVVPSQLTLWKEFAQKLKVCRFDGFMIPSVNLCGDILHYKDVGYKFYLHKVEGLHRGVWKRALKSDGSIDIKMSDTTEVCREDGELARFYPLPNSIEALRIGGVPYVFHFWGVNPVQRIKQNKWWKPHWENRAGEAVDDIILSEDEIKKIPVFEHQLKF